MVSTPCANGKHALCQLSYLECDDGHCSEDDSHDDETQGDFAFMHCTVWHFHEILTVRVKLAVLCAEVVVYRCAFEDALLYTFALTYLIVPYLHDNAQTLDEEDSAENGQQEFLMDDDGTHSNDTADGEAARITHEYLCRVGIVPEETNQCSDECHEENHKLF